MSPARPVDVLVAVVTDTLSRNCLPFLLFHFACAPTTIPCDSSDACGTCPLQHACHRHNHPQEYFFALLCCGGNGHGAHYYQCTVGGRSDHHLRQTRHQRVCIRRLTRSDLDPRYRFVGFTTHPKSLAGADISCRPLCLGGRWLSTRFIIDRYHLDPFQAEGRGLSLPAKGPSPASRLMLVGCITHPSPRAWGL